VKRIRLSDLAELRARAASAAGIGKAHHHNGRPSEAYVEMAAALMFIAQRCQWLIEDHDVLISPEPGVAGETFDVSAREREIEEVDRG